MRRTCIALFGILLFSLVHPTSAHAWFDWLEHLQGPGPFRGWQVEGRIWCFGEEDSAATRRMHLRASLAIELNGRLQDLIKELRASRYSALLDETVSIRDAALPQEARQVSLALRRLPELGRQSVALAASRNPDEMTVREIRKTLDELSITPRADRTTMNLFDIFRTLCAEQVRQESPRTCAPADNENTLVLTKRFNDAQFAAEDLYLTAPMSLLGAFGGVTVSACPVEKDAVRTSAISVVYSDLHTFRSNNGFAGGHEIKLVTVVPTFNIRPMRAISEKLDYFDVAFGAGMYWFSDAEGLGTFDAFSGVVVEPLRFDFHFPQVLAKKHALLAAPSIRYGLSIFPAGFDRGAFGLTNGQPTERLSAEWLQSVSIYFDVAPILYAIKHGH